MSVIIELTVPAEEFELGRILTMERETDIVLETMVPLGARSIPFFSVRNGRESFERIVREHPSVEGIDVVNTSDGETLYALDWQITEDTFFGGIVAKDAHLLEATGTARTWDFELRFPSRQALSEFQEYCSAVDIRFTVERIYNPTKPDAGPWFGLTSSQRNTLARAVESGYYSIPRGTSTEALADDFGVSDQAVTERLRRGIVTLVTNTLLLSDQDTGE